MIFHLDIPFLLAKTLMKLDSLDMYKYEKKKKAIQGFYFIFSFSQIYSVFPMNKNR